MNIDGAIRENRKVYGNTGTSGEAVDFTGAYHPVNISGNSTEAGHTDMKRGRSFEFPETHTVNAPQTEIFSLEAGFAAPHENSTRVITEAEPVKYPDIVENPAVLTEDILESYFELLERGSRMLPQEME